MTSPDGGDGQRRFAPDFLTELFQNPLDPGYADAAARKARGEGPTGTPKKVLSGISALTLIALGFLLVVAYQQTVAEKPARTQARDTLIDQVESRRTATAELQARADGLRSEVAGLREKQLGGAAVARLRDLEAETGLAPVRGSGAKITVADGPTPVDPLTGKRKNEARVRDTDLQQATNALWADGAEAIAINGQRLTATSTIRQAGEAILVDFRPVSTPYQIVAIGPDSLADKFRDGTAGRFFRALSTRYAMAYEVAEVKNVTLDAATEPNLRQAVPSTPPPAAPPSPSSKASKGG
ncbi:DUF881 domain-containing protein [Actinoplanes friuliensis]|jgi:uncharacterized protein YlxW (UPF0749 family)|uniref:DUF881 domain-containing protein n=1 Tax=Actinoplanes friuliensis DSM 7358 TaxID=1246995 RepID=U5W3B1_9ACTN|nr:DUF881 domain-containing protein [Actinoplanes friuliensis]AGZ42485.1 hypothetical protein AFR_21065 [Actinoplanes friuliensis DSM 7358]